MAFARAASTGPHERARSARSRGWRGRPRENDRVGSPRSHDRRLVRPLGLPDLSRRGARGRLLSAPDATFMTTFEKRFCKHQAPSR